MCTNPKSLLICRKGSNVRELLDVPCGKCLECQESYSKEWSFRIMQEASFHIDNCFVTLTYRENPVQLIRKDLQDFIKRLRKFLAPVKIRYFYCGEYGSQGFRPHYHIIIFGWKPFDLIAYKKDGAGNQLYISPKLQDIWGLGFTTVGEVTLRSALYCCKYMQKFQNIPKYLVQPFTGCSTHPGLGYLAYPVSDINIDKIYHNGDSIHIPRYYLKKLEEDGIDLTSLRDNRIVLGDISSSFLSLERRRQKEIKFLEKNY